MSAQTLKRRLPDQTKKSKASKEDPHEEYLEAARGIVHCIDLFCKVDKLIKIGCLLQQEEAAEKGELDESEADKETRKKRLYYVIKDSELIKVTHKMNSVISATRSDDAARLKSQIGHYAAPIPSDGSLKPAIYNGNPSRSHLGVNHPVLASFLCPVLQLTKFKRDPAEGQKKLASGGILMTANDFPAFLWSGNPPGCDYDDEAMTEGLFQGYLIEHVLRHIFTGPSTALGQDSRATRTCNAALHNMTTVEAEHIAYACVQARFGISAQNKWLDIDGKFKYPEFYPNIIDFNSQLWRYRLGGGTKEVVECVAARSTAAKSSAAPAVPDPPPLLARPVTPPPSSPVPTRAESPLLPAPSRSLPMSKVASSSRKSPALSELMDNKDALDDITN
ncbi:hypothetical protein EV702DRAFT_1203360 [Suillus placidus]|uniref:Uncharacterized protein n=1 Tax=Suillus placidus TaxID=48579 RepID=A0A9P6ZJH5_9AGAM|nr:hypothetical protein EV702DRAFT_1203360 [Suillus placidus]